MNLESLNYSANIDNARIDSLGYKTRSNFACVCIFVMLAGLPDSLFAQTASNASLPLSQAQLQQLGEEFSRAHRLQDQGDERAALAIYQKINQAQPKLVEPYINMAAIFTSNGELDKAQQILVRGLESDPASALLFTGLQKVYGAMVRKHLILTLKHWAPSPKLNLGLS